MSTSRSQNDRENERIALDAARQREVRALLLHAIDLVNDSRFERASTEEREAFITRAKAWLDSETGR